MSEIQEQSLSILYAIPKCQFSGASSSGRHAGLIAQIQKGSTLKVTTMTNNKGKHIFHY
jgi:hypothetical protein